MPNLFASNSILTKGLAILSFVNGVIKVSFQSNKKELVFKY